MFEHLLILQPTLLGVLPPNRDAVEQLKQLGAQNMRVSGCSCVAMARNLLYTGALQHAPEQYTTFLLLDADMSFTVEGVKKLIDTAEQTQRLVSGIYGSPGGSVAHCLSPEKKWRVGLGFAAITRKRLQGLADNLEMVKTDRKFWPFCQSRVNDAGEWLSEDYWFSELCGGAVLVDVPAQHWKHVGILPDEDTIQRLISAEAV